MIVDVALPIPVAKSFSYYVPPEWRPHVQVCSRVIVPFRTRTLAGYVTDVREGEKGTLKEITEPADLFPLVDVMLAGIIDWASRYYVTPPGLVLKYVLPPHKNIEKYLVVDTGEKKSLPFRKALSAMGRRRLMEDYKEGRLTVKDAFTGSIYAPVAPKPREDKAENRLYIGGAEDRLACYTSLISERLEKNENVLMLLPDSHGTGDYFSRAFLERFPGRVLWYATSAKKKAGMETYFRTRAEGGFLILGNRSCVFLPARDLGLIIVERHEEDSYRNEEDFRFNAADLAVRRAGAEGIDAVLGTTSPSVEVFKEAEEGHFRVIRGDWPRSPEHSEVIVEKDLASYDGLPEELSGAIKTSLDNNEKIAVYTPRRDYSGSIRCVECRTLFTCPDCGGGLGYQRSTDSLVCASCAKKFPYKETCPQCGSSLIRFARPGAEYFEEQIKLLCPQATVAVITGETPKKEREAIKKRANQSPLALIGTQALGSFYGISVEKLILAGWEELARISGYKAREKMFRVLMHLLDTLNPRHIIFCMEKKKRVDPALFLDVLAFLRDEMERRKTAEFPPYTRFFLVEVSKKTEAVGLRSVSRIREVLDARGYGGAVTGPLFQKRQNYEWRMILTGSGDELYGSLLSLYEIPDVRIEADPQYL